MKLNKFLFPVALLTCAMAVLPAKKACAQETNKWLAVGSLHNWFSSLGCEIEERFSAKQQYGMQWPASLQHQDVQCAKGLWIGAKDFDGVPYQTVHCGPRPYGSLLQEFYPVKQIVISKYAPTLVTADGTETYDKFVKNDAVDPTMAPDRMIYNEVNTALGLTMKRKTYAFSQPYNDNYIVQEYTFVNTGKMNADGSSSRTGALNGVYFYYQYRLSVNAQVAPTMLGNSAQWGVPTMIDARGDGLDATYNALSSKDGKDDNPNHLRFQYAWLGKYTGGSFPAGYDNIGAPIWTPDATTMDKGDTVGRLGGAQFIGILTAHADKSSTDHSDDILQPKFTDYVSSDGALDFNRDNKNRTEMQKEYETMAASTHPNMRHAMVTEPTGYAGFLAPTGFPQNKSQNDAGYSVANSYGPYNIAPGDSVKLVIVEAENGLSTDECIRLGMQFKRKQITALQKNAAVFQGRDSLFQTLQRAYTGYNNNWNFESLTKTPLPPKEFSTQSSGGKTIISWSLRPEQNLSDISGFEIYRSISTSQPGYSAGQWSTKYELIKTISDINQTTYWDTTAQRGIAYYYYLQVVGKSQAGDAMTPAGQLRSSRFAAQTYNPVYMKRAGKTDLGKVRIVPNPFIMNADDNLKFPGEPNKLAFYNLTQNCTIKIYSELGELIDTIHHTDGSSDEYWNNNTSSNQYVVSGVYIAVITDDATGQKQIQKFAVIR